MSSTSTVSISSVVTRLLVGEREVSVHKEQDRLMFSVRNSDQVEYSNRPIPTLMYNTQRAEMLIRIFRDVIQNSLTTDGISRDSFLPVLCTEACILREGRYVPTRFQAALFGRIITDAQIRGEITSRIVGAYWGVFDPASRVVSQFGVDERSTAATFFTMPFH